MFLELTGEEELNLDTAVEASEIIGVQLDELDEGFLRELVDAFAVIAAEYGGEAQEVVRNIPYGLYLEEALAADEPVRLAELEALRDARDGMRGHQRENYVRSRHRCRHLVVSGDRYEFSTDLSAQLRPLWGTVFQRGWDRIHAAE
ncbi:hypothetical protein [Sphingomonas faeni]|uniref:hypothetical protein n=1 Tax=Sphingomonas faeni TaxID=185950 RepID=UPI0020BF552B|nr:hypothetical protein [Sphingomonas faeni]MCK8457728.1 hypothetical protein [Sphingomonas faeni]